MIQYKELLEQAKRKIPQVDFIAIVGTTASGKTALALQLQQDLNAEIIACDSVQVYRGFDIGSAKPSAQIRAQVPHHLIDCADCNEDYNAGRYCLQAEEALADIRNRNKVALVVGGCGLYLRALSGHVWHRSLPSDAELRAGLDLQSTDYLYEQLQKLSPQRSHAIHQHDRVRIHRALELAILLKGKDFATTNTQELQPYIIYLCPERAEVRKRIYARTQTMLAQGLIDEVKELQTQCNTTNCKPMQSIGYRQVLAYLHGKLDYQMLATKISTATCQYAKRQSTWFNNSSMLANAVRVRNISA